MNKIRKTLFEDLTKQAGFYIKDYYSEYLKIIKWIAIMETKIFIYAVIVCKDNESNFNITAKGLSRKALFFKDST